jgi:hypothetical protein
MKHQFTFCDLATPAKPVESKPEVAPTTTKKPRVRKSDKLKLWLAKPEDERLKHLSERKLAKQWREHFKGLGKWERGMIAPGH